MVKMVSLPLLCTVSRLLSLAEQFPIPLGTLLCQPIYVRLSLAARPGVSA
jgi:hypothetical protein